MPNEATWTAATETQRAAWVDDEQRAAAARWDNRHKVDLVLAGGGVKGIAHVGAVKALQDAGYTTHPRIAGTSVGAIVGGLLAIGWTPCEIWDELRKYDFTRMRKTEPVRLSVKVLGERLSLTLPELGPLDQILGLLRRRGSHTGEAATIWMTDVFSRRGPQTFGELFDAAAAKSERPVDETNSPLVVMTTDVKLGRTVMLPRDYRAVYGVDPRDQPIVAAVRASMSIPLYFEPYRIKASYGTTAAGKAKKAPQKHHKPGDLRTSLFIDGGVLANFAVDALDDGAFGTLHPRWPTFGITLMRDEQPQAVGANLRENTLEVGDLDDAVLGRRLRGFADGLIGTLIVGQDTAASDHWWMKQRTIRIKTEPVGIVDFGVKPKAKRDLFKAGYDAARDFVAGPWSDEAKAIGFDGRAEFPLPTPPTKIVACKDTT